MYKLCNAHYIGLLSGAILYVQDAEQVRHDKEQELNAEKIQRQQITREKSEVAVSVCTL